MHRGALLTENFTYDILGQRITHWNSFYGASVKETTDYDLQGRVISSKDFAGDITTNSYAWSGTIGTALGTTGGWTQTTTQLGRSKSETSDIFGNVTTETDYMGHARTNTYDKAGRLTQVSGNNGTYTTTLTHSYFNTGLVSQTLDVAGSGLNTITATYGYDANGRRTKEKYAGTIYKSVSDDSWGSYTSSFKTLQDAAITYDALGRLTSFVNTDGEGTLFNLTMTQQYDLNGNIRRTLTTYPNLVAGSGSLTSNQWFTYDSMNRMVMVNGQSASNTVSSTEDVPDAHTLTYDLAGNRKTSTKRYSDVIDLGDGGGPYKTVHLSQIETYSYDAENRLTGVTLTNGQFVDGSSTTTRDALGRVTAYTESSGTTVVHNRYNIVYNARGQVTQEWTSQKKGSDTYLNKVTNTYNSTTGEISTSASDNYKNGSDSNADDTLLTSYAWYDAGKLLDQRYDRNTGDSGNSIYRSLYTYDGLGRLQRVWIDDGINQAVHFAITPDEQILRRDINNSGPNDPEDHHHYVNGIQVAEYTSDARKNIHDIDYEMSIYGKMSTSSGSSKFYQGGASVSGGEFGTSNFNPLNPFTAGTSSGGASRYVVKTGDTLSSIAAALWGDASLWYKLAEANGLSGDASLIEGQSLTVPVGIVKNSNNASTFNPYDTARATGDLSPTTRKPPKKNKCGVFGQILLAVVQIAVTVILTSVGVPPVLAAMGGNIASQGVGIATGIQQGGFNFGAVAIAGLTAAMAPPGTGNILLDAANAALANAQVQGIAVATGLQKKFDWAGVAAAGVSGGVGSALNSSSTFRGLGNTGQAIVGGGARLIANAATRSILTGSSFGDSVLAGLPDVIAQTVVSMAQDGLASIKERQKAAAEQRAQEGRQLSGTALVGAGVTGETAEPPTTMSNAEAQRIMLKSRYNLAVMAANGDPETARRIFLESYGRTEEQAIAAGKTGQKLEKFNLAGGDEAGFHEQVVYGDGKDYWNRGMTSFGQYVQDGDHSAVWVENAEVMARVNADLAEVDLFFGGMIAFSAAPASIPLMASGTTGAVVGGITLTADLNHAVGVTAPFTGQDRPFLDIAITDGTTKWLDRAALAGGVLHAGSSLVRARLSPTGGGVVDGIDPANLAEGAGKSLRMQYMGATPDKFSRTGAEVVERMRAEGLIVGEGPLLRGNPNNLQLVGADGNLVRIDHNVDMAHRVDAVTWWNETGRFFGPKSPEVRSFMLDSKNYILQQSSINRSAGASLGQTYLPPVAPDFGTLKR